MTRVIHVEKAMKDNPVAKKGESYYWWQFRFGGKHYSKTPPKPAQLTQSEFMGAVYDMQERIEGLDGKDGMEALESERDTIVSEIEELGEAQTEKKDNMPEGLQEGPTGELLQGRADSCREWADNIAGVEMTEPEREEGQSDDDFNTAKEEAVSEALTEIRGCSYEGE